jgi:hypothetical protein
MADFRVFVKGRSVPTEINNASFVSPPMHCTNSPEGIWIEDEDSLWFFNAADFSHIQKLKR